MFTDEPAATTITESTCRNLFDELRLTQINWDGRLSVFDDSRVNLLRTADEIFLRFHAR